MKIRGVSERPAATPEPGTERPSRYNRSFGGLLGAMVVTVLFVTAYIGFRALTRDQPDIEPEADYLSDVHELLEAGVTVVHPCGLPDGWRATSTSFTRGDPPRWGIGFVTDSDEFVGLRQEKTDVDDLLALYVDENPDEGADATPANDLGVQTWQTWSDSGGDHAFTATLAGPLQDQSLLVYGSAPVAEQEELVGLLTVDAC